MILFLFRLKLLVCPIWNENRIEYNCLYYVFVHTYHGSNEANTTTKTDEKKINKILCMCCSWCVYVYLICEMALLLTYI